VFRPLADVMPLLAVRRSRGLKGQGPALRPPSAPFSAWAPMDEAPIGPAFRYLVGTLK